MLSKSLSTSTKRRHLDKDVSDDSSEDARMSSSNARLNLTEEEKNSTVTEMTDHQETKTIVASSNDITDSEHTFRNKKETSTENEGKKKKKRHHLMSLKNERMLVDIPFSDEKIVRNLFKKFTNSWSLFQKHSKLKGKYSV